jgi:hypothetical protein
MKYKIKMSNGDIYTITESEAQGLMSGEKKGLIGINSLKGIINMSFVSSIVPEDKIDHSKMTSGRLHDGTRVIKKYGNWADADNPEVRLDMSYYPELATDEVMSEEEYNNQKILN